jgi:anti-anti-sigma regulatory factor
MPEPSTMLVEITGRIDRADIPALCERVRLSLDGAPADVVVCDVGALADPDCVAVDALARLQLTARRQGRRFVLRDVSPDLQALLSFAGLSEVVGRSVTSGVEPRRQPE